MTSETITPAATEIPAPSMLGDTPLTRKVVYATFNARMFASIIDMTIVMLLAYPVCEWLVGLFYPPIDMNSLSGMFATPMSPDERSAMVWKFLRDQHVFELIVLNNLFQLIMVMLYILPFWFYLNNTPGKFLAGIEIRDATTHEFMSRRQGVKRCLAYILSTFPFALGFVAMLFNRKRQAWHDKIAHTVVVQRERKFISLKRRSEGQ